MLVRRRRRSASSRRRRGATIAEFALVAPILFLFVCGLIEFSRLVMVQQSLTNGAREGCRKAALVTTTDKQDADTAIRDYLQTVVPVASDTEKVRVTFTPPTLAGISPGTPITVAVEVNSSDVTWLPGNLLGFIGDPVLGAEVTQERE